MKNKIIIILVLLMTLSLFTGCKKGGNVTPSPSASVTPTNAGGNVSASPTSGDYNFAIGKYEKNEEGWPKSKYVYDLPLSRTNETFSLWTVSYTPQYLPEDGYAGLGMYKGMREKTGVNINYNLVSAATRSENFATLIASDALTDIISQGAYFFTSGTLQDAVDDDYFANLYPYLDYMPNYCWELYNRSRNSDILDSAFYADDTVVSILGLYSTPLTATGYFLRQDWMDKLNLGKAQDLVTFDDLHSVLTSFKTAYGAEGRYPMMIFSAFELQPVNFVGFNTTPYSARLSYVRVRDGKVEFCGTTSDDRELMTMLNAWWNEGLIDPNYGSYTDITVMTSQLAAGNLGYVNFTPSQIQANESACVDTDCRYEPTRRLKRTADQIIQWGLKPNNITYGSCTVSAKCRNLPLIATYIDWMYSDEGSDWTNWGPEGEIWTYNDKGEKQLTDFALNHEAGTAWLQDCFTYNELADAGIQIWTRNYAYPGGERFVDMYKTWEVPDYGGAYDWPAGAKFTSEQQNEINSLFDDVNTYFTENFIRFFSGDKPFSEWDSYVGEINGLGLARITEIYQEAYDAYKAKKT
jgi:putative aldouronate transport system substrate-binding protein